MQGDPRLGAEPHRVRPPVDHRSTPTGTTARADGTIIERPRQRGPRDRLDRRRRAELRQPRHAPSHDRRHALVAGHDAHRRLPLRRGRRRAAATSGSRRAARSKAVRPDLFLLAEAEDARDARRVRHDLRVGAAPPAQRHRAGEEAARPSSIAYFARQDSALRPRRRTACTSPATTTRTAGTAPSSSAWAPNHAPAFVLARHRPNGRCRCCTPARR